jgi:hypothetical protein
LFFIKKYVKYYTKLHSNLNFFFLQVEINEKIDEKSVRPMDRIKSATDAPDFKSPPSHANGSILKRRGQLKRQAGGRFYFDHGPKSIKFFCLWFFM